MNDSGIAVRKLLARERVPLADLLVVTDDFALPFGKLRFRESGSHGGHNGLRSVIDELGTEKVARLRIGIGDPARGAIDHVLSTFGVDERARLPILLDASADAVEAWAQGGHVEGGQPVEQLRAPGAGRRRWRRRAAEGGRGRRARRRQGRPAHEDRAGDGSSRRRRRRRRRRGGGTSAKGGRR